MIKIDEILSRQIAEAVRVPIGFLSHEQFMKSIMDDPFCRTLSLKKR